METIAMRIVSLLPSTTEIVCALGLQDGLVAVTHECDYPPEIIGLPVITSSTLDPSTTSAAIDAAVSAQLHDDISIYHVDHALLQQLAPDLILTQALCDVCAVSSSAVQQATHDLGPGLQVLSLAPTDLGAVLGTFREIAVAAGRPAAADALLAEVEARIAAVRERAARAQHRPRVACLEWLDPFFGPGHWLPEMVEIAGGAAGLGRPGQHSQRANWQQLLDFDPEVIVLTPCGFDIERTLIEARATALQDPRWYQLAAVRAGNVYAVDGNAHFSRPGPRLIKGLEILAGLIHPALFPQVEGAAIAVGTPALPAALARGASGNAH